MQTVALKKGCYYAYLICISIALFKVAVACVTRVKMVGMLQPEQGDGTTPWPGFSEEDGIDKCKMTLDDASVADDAAEATGKQAPQPTDDDRSEQIQKARRCSRFI